MRTISVSWKCVVAGMAAATLGLWLVSSAATPRAAYGQVPDAGLQRQQMIDELRASNRKLDEIAGLLREIRDAKPREEKKDMPPSRPARP